MENNTPITLKTVDRPCTAEELSRGCTDGVLGTCQCAGTEALAINSQQVNTYSVPCPPGQCRCMSGPCGAGCCDDKYAINFIYGSVESKDPNHLDGVIEELGYFSVQMPTASPRPEPDTKNKICQCYAENKTDSTKLDPISFNCAGENGSTVVGLKSPACCVNLVPSHIIDSQPCLQARIYFDDTPCPPGQCRCMSGPCGAGCCKSAFVTGSQQD